MIFLPAWAAVIAGFQMTTCRIAWVLNIPLAAVVCGRKA